MLYQLSYASPFHPETWAFTQSGTLKACPEISARTHSRSAHHGTEIKVSTLRPEEQTRL